MSKDECYRRLASANRLIAEGRDRVSLQKERVIARADLPNFGESVRLLRLLERSLELMIQSRTMLVRQLMYWPNYR